jgi:threonine dehydrogenase-like Zn-dependent dehydrogenase
MASAVDVMPRTEVMKAVVWRMPGRLAVEEVPRPHIQEPTDAIVRVAASGVCGSDLHLYGKLVPGMLPGDILGHEVTGVVEEVGPGVPNLRPGDRVVLPFNIACGRCFMCERGLQSQCETTQNREVRKGGSLFGYTHLYGGFAGGQAQYLRVPMAHYGPIKIEDDLPDETAVLLADVLPTAWQGVRYAEVRPGDSVAVFGLGPIGQMAVRIALLQGAGLVVGVDRVPERLRLARASGARTIDFSAVSDVSDLVKEMTGGRGADSVIDCAGMEASGSRADSVLQALKVQPDKLQALRTALRSVRRGGVVSIVGVYLGWYPLFFLGQDFDRQLTFRMGQANVRHWTDEVLAALRRQPDLTSGLVTHRFPLEEAPSAYEAFQTKRDGIIKPVLLPWPA